MNTILGGDYEALGADFMKRESDIGQAIKDGSKSNYPLEFRGDYIDIPIIEVRINLPIYRLANGRTRTFQLEYLALNPDEDRDLFTKDENSWEAQFAQHKILLQLADEEDLFKKFQKEGLKQTEPIICTHDGVVVNGNRRLCAWRELYARDKDKYSHLQMIRIAVLPKCDDAAIEDLENLLQIQNPMKAEYCWHTIAIMARERQNSGVSLDDIAKSYDKDVKEIKTLIDACNYAEQYLIHVGKADQWSIVDKDYYAFEQLVKCRKKLTSNGEKELFETLVFKFIKDKNIEGRLYSRIPLIRDYLPVITEKLKDVIPSSTCAQPDNLNSSDISLLAGDDSIDADDASVLAVAIEELNDAEDIQMLVQTVNDVIETQEQLKKEKKSKDFLLNQVTKAATAMKQALSSKCDYYEINLLGVKEQLDDIEKNVRELRERLNDHAENDRLF